MKTTTKITILMVAAAISMSQMLKADDTIALPVINKPAILEEGTQRDLSQAQIAELLPWAKDSKLFLTDLLDNIQGLSTADKIDHLQEGIEQVVGDSAPKNSELLMRYALNRGLVIKGILDKEMTEDVVGTADAKLRVLRASIQMALKYYDTDMAILAKKTTAPFVIFGLDYFSFLTELNKSIFDASAQYAVERTSLEWLQWDLYRDLNNAAYAPQIVKINNSLKIFPNKKLTDAQSIASIRQMKAVAQQLKVEETLKKIVLDKQLAEARSAAERAEILKRQQEEADRLEEQRQEAADRAAGRTVESSTLGRGDTVIFGSSIRVVEYIADNGQVVLKEDNDYSRTVVARSSVQKALSYSSGLSKDNVVIFGTSIRVVEYLGSNGAVVLREDRDYSRTYTTKNNVNKTVASYGKLKITDRVLFGSSIRVVEFLDETGKVVLAEDNDYSRTYTTASNVSKVQ